MRRIHFPVLLSNVDETHANGFVTLFTLESTCRALLMTVVPLQAYAFFKDAQQVSILYLSVSGAGLIVSLGVPMLIHLVKRRWMLTIGVLTYIASAALFSAGQLPLFVLALALQISATAVLEVIINLYMLDHIPRKELTSFEPKRLLFSGMAFMAGPYLGVWLNQSVMYGLTFALVGLMSLILLATFWKLRLAEGKTIRAAKTLPPRPLRFVPRFFGQRRLLLAWALAIGRNGWWLMFFIYTPIFAAQAGFSATVGGAIISAGVAPMILVRVWGRLGRRIGIRRLLYLSYTAVGVTTMAAGLAAELAGSPVACIALLLCAAFLATLVDGAGNVPFLRAVHPHERAEMTAVYATFRHATSLLTPALFAVVLAFLPLAYVFVSGGIASIGMALLARKIPRKL